MNATFAVFVQSIIKAPGGATVTASNGSVDGPPAITFRIDPIEIPNCHLGKRYHITVTDGRP